MAVMGVWFGKKTRGLVMGVWNAHTSVGNILGGLIATAMLVQVCVRVTRAIAPYGNVVAR